MSDIIYEETFYIIKYFCEDDPHEDYFFERYDPCEPGNEILITETYKEAMYGTLIRGSIPTNLSRNELSKMKKEIRDILTSFLWKRLYVINCLIYVVNYRKIMV